MNGCFSFFVYQIESKRVEKQQRKKNMPLTVRLPQPLMYQTQNTNRFACSLFTIVAHMFFVSVASVVFVHSVVYFILALSLSRLTISQCEFIICESVQSHRSHFVSIYLFRCYDFMIRTQQKSCVACVSDSIVRDHVFMVQHIFNFNGTLNGQQNSF